MKFGLGTVPSHLYLAILLLYLYRPQVLRDAFYVLAEPSPRVSTQRADLLLALLGLRLQQQQAIHAPVELDADRLLLPSELVPRGRRVADRVLVLQDPLR